MDDRQRAAEAGGDGVLSPSKRLLLEWVYFHDEAYCDQPRLRNGTNLTRIPALVRAGFE